MKILSLIFTAVFLFVSSPTYSMLANSDTEPARLTESRGVTQYAYNIQEVNGTWEYDYVEIEDQVTEAKIKEALRMAKNEDQAFDPADVETKYTRVEEELAHIAQMTYAEIDEHIDTVFGSLTAAQKASLKKLYKSVLALIKMLDLE